MTSILHRVDAVDAVASGSAKDMISFDYRGFDSLGRNCSGLIEALDMKQARERLIESGILPELVVPAGQARRRWFAWAARRFSLERRAVFYQELLSLMKAGLPLAKALDVLIQSSEAGATRSILASVRDRIKEGDSLADALSQTGACVGGYEQAAIHAAERAGSLEAALERLAVFLTEQNRLRDSVITALIYPAIVIVIAIGIAAGLLGFAVPAIGELLQEEAGLRLPFITRIMIGLGGALAKWGLPIFASLLVASFLAWRRVTREPALMLRASRMTFRIPILGRARELLVNLRFARTLSLLLTGDIPLIESMKLAGQATGSLWVDAMVEKEAESVKHGSSLADALRRIPPLAGLLAHWAQVGEAGGRLTGVLESAGERLQQRWERFIARLMALLEPALIVAISAFVLLIVLSILLPIMSLNTALL